MKNRILFTLALILILLLITATASAASIEGPGRINYQVNLPTEKPAAGGFYSRGPEIWLDGWNNGTPDPVWSVAPMDGGPAFTMESYEWSPNGARFKQIPTATYTAGRTYNYRVSCTWDGVTYTKEIPFTFINEPLPTGGFGLSVATVDFSTTPATIGNWTACQKLEMYMQAGNTYVVSEDLGTTATFQSYSMNEADWTDREWEDIWAGSDSRFRNAAGECILDLSHRQVYTAKAPGTYEHSYVLQYWESNLACYIPYTLYLTDSQGNIPDTDLILQGDYPWADGSLDAIDYPLYIGLPLYGDVWQWDDLVKVFVSNYEEMAQEYGGEPSWTVTRTDQGTDPLDYYLHTDDLFGQNGRIMATLNSMPTQPMTAELTVTCTWGGKTASKVIRIQAFQLSSLPTGLDNLPDEIETQVGSMLTIAPTLLPAGWNENGYANTLFIANGLLDFAERDTINGPSETYLVKNAGIYQDTIGLMAGGSIMVMKNVVFKVKDANGSIPQPNLTLENNSPVINRYLGMTRDMEEQTGVFSWNYLASAEIADFEQIQTQVGGQPTWSVTQLTGTPIPFTWSEEQDGKAVDIRLEGQALADMNYQPQQAILQISCSWAGVTASTVTEIKFLYAPNGLPTGIDYNNGSDVVECSIGDTLMINPTIVPSTWTLPGYTSHSAFNSNEFERFCTIVNEGSWGREVTVTAPGIYKCFVGIGADTITAGRWVTYRVKDANGNVPAPDIRLFSNRGMSHEMNFYLGMRFTERIIRAGEVQTEPQIDHYYMTNASELAAEYPNDTAVWKLTRLQGTAEIQLDNSYLPDTDLQLKKLPDAPEDAVWKLECDYGDTHWEADYTIHFMDSPTGLPTGIDMDFGNVLVVKSGDRLDLENKVRFKNGWSIPGENIETMLGGDYGWMNGVIQDEHFIWNLANTPGIYACNVSKSCGNIRWLEDFTLIITESDGTMNKNDYTPFGSVATLPAGVTRIESEAFAGTTLTEIDIPAGVSIANDAFSGTSLVAVYTHNDPNTIQWAVDHGYAALTD